MKTRCRSNFISIAGRLMIGLFFAALIGSIDVVPALGKDDHNKNMGKHDNGRYENKGRGNNRDHYKAYRHDQDRYEDERREYYHDLKGRRVYRYHNYRERVYAPPRFFYAPPPPPGISIFFPPIFIH